MKSLTSSFTKVCVYDRPLENVKTVFSKKLRMTGEMKYVTSPFTKVCVYDQGAPSAPCLRPSTRSRENSVFKSIHFGKRFRMYASRIT